MEWYEAAFDRFYPILYGHRDAEEAEKAMETLARFLEGQSPVLDLGSGNGRYLSVLRARGIEAFGLDLSHYLLQESVETGELAGVVVQGDMRFLPFLGESFGGVLNMFTSFGYFSVDTDNLRVLHEVRRVLKSGGAFVFDFLNAEKISGDLLTRSSRQSGGYDIEERRRIEDHGKYLVKRVTIADPETGKREELEERLRLYTHEDLHVMFRSVGLTPVEVFGDYSGNSFTRGVSERVIVIAKKK